MSWPSDPRKKPTSHISIGNLNLQPEHGRARSGLRALGVRVSSIRIRVLLASSRSPLARARDSGYTPAR